MAKTGSRAGPACGRVRAVTAPDEPQKRRSLGLSARVPSVQVTPDMLAALEAEAQRQGISLAGVVRQALRQWLDAQQHQS
jgi:predicted HicB family RNase H-like nuclease